MSLGGKGGGGSQGGGGAPPFSPRSPLVSEGSEDGHFGWRSVKGALHLLWRHGNVLPPLDELPKVRGSESAQRQHAAPRSIYAPAGSSMLRASHAAPPPWPKRLTAAARRRDRTTHTTPSTPCPLSQSNHIHYMHTHAHT